MRPDKLLWRFLWGLHASCFGVECPNCARQMKRWETLQYDCRCGATVDLRRAGWKFGHETAFRRLPGAPVLDHTLTKERTP